MERFAGHPSYPQQRLPCRSTFAFGDGGGLFSWRSFDYPCNKNSKKSGRLVGAGGRSPPRAEGLDAIEYRYLWSYIYSFKTQCVSAGVTALSELSRWCHCHHHHHCTVNVALWLGSDALLPSCAGGAKTCSSCNSAKKTWGLEFPFQCPRQLLGWFSLPDHSRGTGLPFVSGGGNAPT